MCKHYDDPEVIEYLKSIGREEPAWDLCEKCGEKVHIGDWPECQGKFSSGHEPTAGYRPFKAFYDIQLGRQINSLADWNRAMKETGWDLASSKHDRVSHDNKMSTRGYDDAFNRAVRDHVGGIANVQDIIDACRED